MKQKYPEWGCEIQADVITATAYIAQLLESGKLQVVATLFPQYDFARIIGGVGSAIIMVAIIPVSQSVGAMFTERGMSQAKGLQYGFIAVTVVLTVLGTLAFQCAAYTKERVKQPSDEAKGFIDNVKIMWGCMPIGGTMTVWV
mgnify:CR=1 FL=1